MTGGADGYVKIKTLIDNAQAQKDFADLRKKIAKLSSDLGSKTNKQNAIANEMDKASAAAEETRNNIRQLKSEIASLESVNLTDNTSAEYLSAQSRLPELRGQLDEQSAKLQKQTEAADKVAKSYQEVTAEVDKLTAELDEAGAKAKNLALEVNGGGAGGSPAKALNRAATATSKFRKRIIELTKSALIFSVLTKALTVMRDWLGNAVASSEEASTAFAQLKGTLQGLAAPILNSVIPVLTRVVQVLTQIISLLSRGVAALFGTTNKQALESAKGLNAQQKALEGVGGAASDAEKQLASFDEINKLTEPSAGGGGGGGGGIGAIFEEVALPDWMIAASERLAESFGKLYEALNKIKENPAIQKIATFVKEVAKQHGGYVITGLANSIELLANAIELLDLALSGDFKGAWERIKEIVSNSDNIIGIGGPFGWSTDIGTWLGKQLREAVELWWKEDITPYFAAKKHKKLWTEAFKGWDQGWKYIQQHNSAELSSWWSYEVAPWFAPQKHESLWAEAAKGWDQGWKYVQEYSNTALSTWWVDSIAPFFEPGKWAEVISGVKDGLVYGFRRALNAVIDTVNGYIREINKALIFTIPDTKLMSTLFGEDIAGKRVIIGKLETIPNVPYLAQGAVIPPNREFMAVLGDQKSGTNIETPLSTMIEAFRTALNEGGYGGARTVVLEVDGRELGRATFDAYNAEARRLGVSLEVSNA